MKSVLLLLFLSIVWLSCQKVIDIDLNTTEPKIIIEADFSNLWGSHDVRISKSVNFDKLNVFPPVTNAKIVIIDEDGNSEVLHEKYQGYYQTSFFQCFPLRKYTITIEIEGQKFESQTTMPFPISIDSLKIDNGFGFRPRKQIVAYFKDPANEPNYYRLIEIVNKDTLNNIFITDDTFRDGKIIAFNLRTNEEKEIKSKDKIIVLLQCIDKSVYEYFRTLRLISSNAGMMNASPTNPTSNFTNGAFGYFSTYSVTQKEIVVP